MDATYKICTKCGPPAQPLTEFYFKPSLGGRRFCWCRTCCHADRTARRNGTLIPRVKPPAPTHKVCTRCGGAPQPIDQFPARGDDPRRHSSWCLACQRTAAAKRYHRHAAELRTAKPLLTGTLDERIEVVRNEKIKRGERPIGGGLVLWRLPVGRWASIQSEAIYR